MKALQLSAYGGNSRLQLVGVPQPEPAPGEVLIHVHYAGLNPVDYKTRDGTLRVVQSYSLPVTMGNEVAGDIAAIGADVTGWAVGDEVLVRLAKDRMGGFAEYVTTDASLLARKPPSLPMDVAAGVPLVALTAWQCLFEYGRIGAGSRVLIHAGAGAVGRAAVQMAKNAGAVVATTVSERGRPVAAKLGADVIIDYRQQRFEDLVSNQDFVLDTVGGGTLMRSFKVLRRGGRLCSIAGVPELRTAGDLGKRLPLRVALGGLFALMAAPLTLRGLVGGVDYRFLFMRADGARLQQIADQIETGKLEFDVAKTYEMDDYAAAFEDLEHARTSGKLVMKVGNSGS
jgi:NADPH:quinone reductase-like Zn-dependent oxidoreductase